MNAINYSSFREHLKSYCDKVCESNETYIVTRKSENNVVVLSINEYNSLINEREEALELLRSIIKRKTLEEYAKPYNGELGLDGEYDFGERLGREVWE